MGGSGSGFGFGFGSCSSLWRAGCALSGPRKRWRLGAGKARRVGARDRAQFAASTRRCCQRTPGALPRSRRAGARRPPLWGGLLFAYFLLATQEKVGRSPKASESSASDSDSAPRMRREAMSMQAKSKALAPCPGKVRPVLNLSKGRDDGADFELCGRSIAPEGASCSKRGMTRSPEANESFASTPGMRREAMHKRTKAHRSATKTRS